MIANKIKDARLALGVLAGQITEDQWGLIKCVQGELADAAQLAEQMEKMLAVPGAPRGKGPADAGTGGVN
ncbi:hypothetical protein [Nitratidesulfovibrio termitidis]|uniref:hypothetical protein n=1 Tax=Nitratidesulfovibrio termitidis TaxID=42252 RepID=UPI000411C624|nr:hypothetical protein [Nitratidesulfovibrio termitidis]